MKNIKEKIKNHFLLNPTDKLRVRHIEKTLKVPLPSVIRYVIELEHEGILTSLTIGGAKFYTADRMSSSFLLEKRIFNLRSINTCGLINHLKETTTNATIVLFGSYSRGEDIETSDIDLYIETKKEVGDLGLFERRLSRTIQLFPHKTIREIRNHELANNIINGITVNGFLEVIR